MRYRYASALAAFFLLWAVAWFCVNCEQAERYAAEKGAGSYLCGTYPDSGANGQSEIQCKEVQVMRHALGQTESSNPVIGIHTVTRGSRGAASELSGEDYEALLKIVEAEAGTEDRTGKLLVADVVLNRVESERFPDTVRQVVYQESGGRAQFSPAADGSIEKVAVSGETEEAVRRALGGEDVSGGALYFVSRKAADPENMRWFDENLTFLFSYGGHEFFR